MEDASFTGVLGSIATDAAWFLALLLTGAALHKTFSRARAQRAAGDLLTLSRRGAGVAAGAAAVIEGLAASCLLLPASRSAGAALAATLWGTYLGLMGLAILKGRTSFDCGCSFGKAHRLLGRWQMLRTGSLLVLAVAVAVAGLYPALNAHWSLSDMSLGELASGSLAAFALLGLYVALDHVLALEPLRAGVLQ